MITTKRGSSREALRAGKKRGAAKRAAPYHHGSLREAMLRAAESILERDGIGGLTLRAAARKAGVSHAAPKNHFGDVMGLLSDSRRGWLRAVSGHNGGTCLQERSG